MRISEILFEARIYNQEFLNNLIYYYSVTLPQQAQEFIKRIITKAAQVSINQTRPILAPNATEWDKKDLENGTLVSFVPSDELRNKLRHIHDWLRHSEITEQELNSLRGIQNIDIAYEHANRFFDRLNKKASSDEDESGLETIMSWPDGFKLVKLNTAQCLNREGKLMQHCVGSYANEIQRGTEILSLRDPQNNPHVTIEKNGNDIDQIKGKNNKAPIEKYHKYILDYLNKNTFNNIRDLKNIGLIKVNNKIYELNNLPDNLTIAGDLDLRGTNLTKLPENLTVNGSLDLQKTPITKLPDNFTVNGNLYLANTQIKELSDNLTINGSLDLSNTQIIKLPDNLTVKGHLNLSNTPITKLPDNLTVNGYLNLSNTPITKLPDNLTVNGYLILYKTPIIKLPDNLTVNGWLDLANTQITKLPENLTVNGSLNLQNTKIKELPDNLTVNDDLFISYNMKLTHIPEQLKNKIKIV